MKRGGRGGEKSREERRERKRRGEGEREWMHPDLRSCTHAQLSMPQPAAAHRRWLLSDRLDDGGALSGAARFAGDTGRAAGSGASK